MFILFLLAALPVAPAAETANSQTTFIQGGIPAAPAETRESLLANPAFKTCIEGYTRKSKPPDCSKKPPAPGQKEPAPDLFAKVEPTQLPETLMEGNLKEMKTALQRQIANCQKQKQDQNYTLGGQTYTRKQICLEANQKLLELANSSSDYAAFMTKAKEQMDFYQYKCDNGKGQITFTGYYSPVIEGSAVPTDRFKYPVYKSPPDLVVSEETVIECPGTPAERKVKNTVMRRKNPDGSLGPHFTREEINSKGALKGKGLELVYLDSAWAVHSLHIQGSGIVVEKDSDGRVTKTHYLNYGNRNGFRWLGTGAVLKCLNVKALSMDAIGKWLEDNPQMADAALNMDESYVFFKDDGQPPKGVENIHLTPGHSLAVDSSKIPIGTPVLYSTKRPVVQNGKDQGSREFQSLAIAQDVGGAIKGCRIDIYFGEGDDAGAAGGRMKQPGPVFLAVPKTN